MTNPEFLNKDTVTELSLDAAWCMKGNGPGYMSAVDVRDLCHTVEELREQLERQEERAREIYQDFSDES